MALRDCINYTVPDQGCCEDYGSCAKLYRYENPVDVNCGSGMNRGCPTSAIDIIIDIQPSNGLQTGEQLMLTQAGHASESKYKFYFNPHHPTNVAANSGQPLFLVTSDSRFVTEGFDSKQFKHSDVIEWMGEKFMVCQIANWGGENCLSENCDVIDHQVGFIETFNDDHQERLATIDNDTFAYDGELRQP